MAGCFCFCFVVVVVVVCASNSNYDIQNLLSWLSKKDCNDDTVFQNMSDLQEAFETKVYGQHIATKAISLHVRDHVKGKSQHAMALSFHGGIGTGKKFVTKLIAKSIFGKGDKSPFYHFIDGCERFQHQNETSKYQGDLRKEIENQVKKCQKSMIIIDNVDQIPAGVIDIIFPYLNKDSVYDGVDYRQTMFIFMSNTYSDAIRNILFQHLKHNKRETLQMSNIESQILKTALYERKQNGEPGGWFQSDIMETYRISAYIPFLPLERKHIEECIKAKLRLKKYFQSDTGINDSEMNGFVESIADKITYGPGEGRKGMFSDSGCSLIPSLVTEEIKRRRH